jgi:phosphate transport system permease protein
MGYFALLFVTPILRTSWPDKLGVYNMLSAGIVMGIMILPLISSMSEDALSAVPNSLREAAYAMGATRSRPAPGHRPGSAFRHRRGDHRGHFARRR